MPDDLVGWSEKKDGETTKHDGFFDGIDLSREEAEAMIMAARVRVGWIEAAGAEEPEAETEGEEARFDRSDDRGDTSAKRRSGPASSRGGASRPRR